MLLGPNEGGTRHFPTPEALIEEARQRQRRRSRRRQIALVTVALLAALAFGIDRLAQGGSGVQAKQPVSPAAAKPRTVTYEKVVTLKIVPHLPVEKTTIETWQASSAPGVFRQIVTIPGRPPIEIGGGPGYGRRLGPEQVGRLYDASSRTIYQTGLTLVPKGMPPTPRQMFKRFLAGPEVRLAGSRTYLGRSVFVVSIRGAGFTGTQYVDKRTYRPMMSDMRGTDLHTVFRTLVYKTLPATRANLALTSLRTAHPQAQVVLRAPSRIKALYGEAAFPSGQNSTG